MHVTNARRAPQPPADLHPLVRAILEGLQQQPDAAALVIGGGVALKHYLDYWPTKDLDAWWGPNTAAVELYECL